VQIDHPLLLDDTAAGLALPVRGPRASLIVVSFLLAFAALEGRCDIPRFGQTRRVDNDRVHPLGTRHFLHRGFYSYSGEFLDDALSLGPACNNDQIGNLSLHVSS
jgi:hypothetical protein